jgi:hypothetical protein
MGSTSAEMDALGSLPEAAGRGDVDVAQVGRRLVVGSERSAATSAPPTSAMWMKRRVRIFFWPAMMFMLSPLGDTTRLNTQSASPRT